MQILVHQSQGRLCIRSTINQRGFEYDNRGFQSWGYLWDPEPNCDLRRPIEYFKAQLAFRGFATGGDDVRHLKTRLLNVATNKMDNKVRAGGLRMKVEYHRRHKVAKGDAEGDVEQPPNPNRGGSSNARHAAGNIETVEPIPSNLGGEERAGDGLWDITGTWQVTFDDFGFGYDHKTMVICTTRRQALHETYGRFDFGDFKGVLRLSCRQKKSGYNWPEQRTHEDEFLLDHQDIPSRKNPTWCYRWRGVECGEGVIQLNSERNLLTMTFSHGGSRVKGTWIDDYEGACEFSGVKQYAGNEQFNILHEWNSYNEAAYKKANRDRWRY